MEWTAATPRWGFSARGRRLERLAAYREATNRFGRARLCVRRDPRGLLHADEGQGLSRFPWLGHSAKRHHEYTHNDFETPLGQRMLRDICRSHIEEFAYLLAKLKSIRGGEGTLLDHTCAVLIHEHADANSLKNNGLAMIVAGHVGNMKTGLHSKIPGTAGDLYLTLADEVLNTKLGSFPTADKKLNEIV